MLNIESPQITISSRNSVLGNKLVVRDDDDDEISDDADDEVFIQDGRNGIKHDEDRGVKRPLMPPRRKNFKSSPFQSNRHRRAVVRALWAPCCYAGLFISIFLVVIGIVVFCTSSFLSEATPWTQQRAKELLPPNHLMTRTVWNMTLPRLLSESNLILHDANSDGTLDIIFGYSTAVDRNADPGFICAMYFHGKYPCYGGVLALDGVTGETLWQHWTEEGVFYLDCSADLTGDGSKDCLATGKKGLFCAINGRDGSMVWHLSPSDQHTGVVGEMFSPRFIMDVDGDKVQDIVAAHTSTSGPCGHSAASGKNGLQGHLLIISGAAGQVLQCVPTPNHAESFIAPQLLTWPDGSSVLLVATGGPNSVGGLHALPMHPLQGIQLDRSQNLYSSKEKGGLLTPALLVDLNGDGTEDIVAAMFSSMVIVFDGVKLEMLWNYSIPSSELHSPISAGYFNQDDVPDIIVRFHVGPGFPNYHYSQTIVLDGRNGKPLLTKPISGAPSSDVAPSLSLEGHGNDAFLMWSSGCLARAELSNGPLPPSAKENGESDWDKCDPKFNATSSDLKIFSQHIQPPGLQIFHTEETPQSQQAQLQEDYKTATAYIDGHPDFWDEYATLLCTDDPALAENSAKQPVGPVAQREPGREQFEDISYQSLPHQVRKHGKPTMSGLHPYYQPSTDMDYDNLRPQEDGNYDDQFSRTGRESSPMRHKILATHLASGAIAPRLVMTDEGVDLIFTSHWSTPKDSVLPAFQRCLASQLTQHRVDRKHNMMLSCQRQAQTLAKECWSGAVQVSGNSDRPFGASRMAHMTVHRVSLQLLCQNVNSKPGQRCAGILPWNLQSLPSSPSSNGLFHLRSAGVYPVQQ